MPSDPRRLLTPTDTQTASPGQMRKQFTLSENPNGLWRAVEWLVGKLGQDGRSTTGWSFLRARGARLWIGSPVRYLIGSAPQAVGVYRPAVSAGNRRRREPFSGGTIPKRIPQYEQELAPHTPSLPLPCSCVVFWGYAFPSPIPLCANIHGLLRT